MWNPRVSFLTISEGLDLEVKYKENCGISCFFGVRKIFMPNIAFFLLAHTFVWNGTIIFFNMQMYKFQYIIDWIFNCMILVFFLLNFSIMICHKYCCSVEDWGLYHFLHTSIMLRNIFEINKRVMIYLTLYLMFSLHFPIHVQLLWVKCFLWLL